jgi:hypothetical protein
MTSEDAKQPALHPRVLAILLIEANKRMVFCQSVKVGIEKKYSPLYLDQK